MAVSISSPDPQILLPPILACLPTAFASPRPPPGLLPLTSPILKQKLQYLADSSGSWLPLLCWDSDQSRKLQDIVESLELEPHPISGEIELPDIEGPEYRRLDPETLHTRFQLPDLQLAFIYLWCDEGGDDGSGWRLAELLPSSAISQSDPWSTTVASADDHHATMKRPSISLNNGAAPADAPARPDSALDDGSYWDMYDLTPGLTPGRTPNRTPAKPPAPYTMQKAFESVTSAGSAVQPPTAAELDYFARYMSEVQPALDPEDPDEPTLGLHESTLHGAALAWDRDGADPAPTAEPVPVAAEPARARRPEPQLECPKPRSSRSSSSAGSVEKLEEEAARANRAEVAVKQHISTDIKSLFRLARASGMDRDEFVRVIQTELDVLVMMDQE